MIEPKLLQDIPNSTVLIIKMLTDQLAAMLLALLLPVETPGSCLTRPIRLVGVLPVVLVILVLVARTPGVLCRLCLVSGVAMVVLVLLEGTRTQVVREAILDIAVRILVFISVFTSRWLPRLTIGEGELGHIVRHGSLQEPENISLRNSK